MTRKSWSEEQKALVRENIKTMPVAEMARILGKSENAVRLFMHRDRIQYRPAVKNNIVMQMLTHVFRDPRYFSPTREFYLQTGITQVRFWKLYRGEASPTEEEYHALIEHFQVSKVEMFENRQLRLFD